MNLYSINLTDEEIKYIINNIKPKSTSVSRDFHAENVQETVIKKLKSCKIERLERKIKESNKIAGKLETELENAIKEYDS